MVVLHNKNRYSLGNVSYELDMRSNVMVNHVTGLLQDYKFRWWTLGCFIEVFLHADSNC